MSRYLLDLIWPWSGPELLSFVSENTYNQLKTRCTNHMVSSILTVHGRPLVHAEYAQHIHNTHRRPNSILTNSLHAVIGCWLLLIIPHSWSFWLDFNAVHVHERSKELPHVVHNACRLFTMYNLGGTLIIITWTFFANRGRCRAKFIELFLDVRCWLIVESWRFCSNQPTA